MNIPYFLLLDDDPLVSEITVYRLEEGATFFGTSTAVSDMVLQGEERLPRFAYGLAEDDLANHHCVIINKVELNDRSEALSFFDSNQSYSIISLKIGISFLSSLTQSNSIIFLYLF